MKVSIEDNSIPNSALLDGYSGCLGGVASSSTATTDSSIITLEAGELLTDGHVVGLVNNRAVLATWVGVKAIGIALDRADNIGDIVRVKISGLLDIGGLGMLANTPNGEYYIFDYGHINTFYYNLNSYWQRVGYVHDNKLLINFSEFVLMTGDPAGTLM